MSDQETKEIVKEAIKEWLDEQFLAFGKWTLRSLTACAFAVLFYFYLKYSAGK